jgi:hypothetical protein
MFKRAKQLVDRGDDKSLREAREICAEISVPTIIRYLEAVERLDPSIVRDAVAELNRNEYALGRISGRYH